MNNHRYEVIANFVLWTGAVFYSIYGVIKVRKSFENYDDTYDDFTQGWLITTVKKDTSDSEWETAIKFLRLIYPWLVIHLAVSEYLRQTYFKVLPYWQVITAASCILHTTGVFGMLIMITQPILFEGVQKFKYKLLIWTCCGVNLILIHYIKSYNFLESIYIQITEAQHYIIIVATCWINLRCLSYYLDNITDKHKSHSFINFLAYCFYLPLVFLGPFIPFSSFVRSQQYYKVPFLRKRIIALLWDLMHFGFWLIFTEFSLHFVYVSVLSYHPELVISLNNWALYGYGYCMGQFFHLKYVVFYGLSTSLSKFEHIEVPSIPKCIGRIHLYSDMWKYFDRGLYNFLLRYIYLPTLKSTIINVKIFSSFLCFLFVYVWHGIQYHILVWAAFNFIGICIEHICSIIVNSVQCNFYSLDEKWRQRLLCIISSPLLAMSAVSNFYFFAGMEIGNIFVDRFIHSPVSNNLLLLFFLSCCCYVSNEVKKWEICYSKKKM